MKKLLLITTAIILSACSSDSDTKKNAFEFNGQSYAATKLWVTDVTTVPGLTRAQINLTNKYFTEDGDVGRNTVDLTIDEPTLAVGTFTIVHYSVATDVIMQNGDLVIKTLLADRQSPNDEIHATGTVTIDKINGNIISMTYVLMRNDGKIIEGSFNGKYTRPASI